VLDTNAVALLGGRNETVENTAEIFAQARAQGIEWLPIRSASDPAWRQVELPPDMRARVEQDLAAGSMVLVPEKPVQLGSRPVSGWWRIDPGSGQVLGMMESGEGQAVNEYTMLNAVLISSLAGFAQYSNCAGSGGNSGAKTFGCALCGVLVGFGVLVTLLPASPGLANLAVLVGTKPSIGIGVACNLFTPGL
jgi:hypothetical protein